MNRTLHTRLTVFLFLTAILTNLLFITSAPAIVHSVVTKNLCQIAGPYGKMQAKLQKTLFRVDVLTIEFCVDAVTQTKLKNLVHGTPYSPQLAQKITEQILDTSTALILVRFDRNISVSQFIDGIKESLQKAHEAGLISFLNYKNVSNHLSIWFGSIKDRGLKTGDQLSYQIEKDSVITTMVAMDGHELLSHKNQDLETRRALIAGYLAPESDLGPPLIQSLFNNSR